MITHSYHHFREKKTKNQRNVSDGFEVSFIFFTRHITHHAKLSSYSCVHTQATKDAVVTNNRDTNLQMVIICLPRGVFDVWTLRLQVHQVMDS